MQRGIALIAVVVIECGPTAFTLLAAHASPSDGCDSGHNAAVTTDAAGTPVAGVP